MGRNVQVRIDGGLVTSIGLVIFGVALMFGAAAAWVTHIIWVIGKLAGNAGITGGQVILGLLGSFVPPVGVIHGVMIWFGHGMG